MFLFFKSRWEVELLIYVTQFLLKYRTVEVLLDLENSFDVYLKDEKEKISVVSIIYIYYSS